MYSWKAKEITFVYCVTHNNLWAYINMIKCSPFMLFDMPACHAWAHKQRIFDTPYKHYYLS